MQMLERYLRAIEFWLPNDQRQDLIAEIAEDLHSQIEDRQTALGRNLTDAELEEILKQRGRPLVVASRYRPQESLIGPVWFPAYLFVLKTVGLFYVIPWFIVFLVVHRVQHPAVNWGTTLLVTWNAIQTVAFVAVGVITLVFAALQIAEQRTHFLENWNPARLPKLTDDFNIPLGNSLAEIVANAVFLCCWIAYLSNPVIFDGPAFKLSLMSVSTYFFWGYLATGVCNIALAVENLRNRRWDRVRASIRLAIDLGGGLLFCSLLKTDLIATLYLAKLDSAQTLQLKHAIELVMSRSYPFAMIVVVIVAAIDLSRIVRLNRRRRYVLTPSIDASSRT